MKASLGFKLLLVVLIGSFCNAEDVDINKMTMKEIKRELAARGQQCRGCLEKADFVELLKSTLHLPRAESVEPKGGVDKTHEKSQETKPKREVVLAGGYVVGDVVESLINHGDYMVIGDRGTVIGPCDSDDTDRSERVLVQYPGGKVNVIAATELRKFWWEARRERAQSEADQMRWAEDFPLPDIAAMEQKELVDYKWALKAEIKSAAAWLAELKAGRTPILAKDDDASTVMPTIPDCMLQCSDTFEKCLSFGESITALPTAPLYAPIV
jgi:hypothetical protein